MIFTEDRELSREDVAHYNSILAGTTPWPSGSDDTIFVMTVDFGYGWEIDVKICQGEPTPFLDVVLFHDGSEVYAWGVDGDDVTGEWQVVMGHDINRAFRLQIFPEMEEGS